MKNLVPWLDKAFFVFWLQHRLELISFRTLTYFFENQKTDLVVEPRS
jgi:hypothetical protein